MSSFFYTYILVNGRESELISIDLLKIGGLIFYPFLGNTGKWQPKFQNKSKFVVEFKQN